MFSKTMVWIVSQYQRDIESRGFEKTPAEMDVWREQREQQLLIKSLTGQEAY